MANITGDLLRLHPVTITVDGPSLSEQSQAFTDYRFDVQITTPSGSVFLVPGYWAADGDAANTSATSGDQWIAKFTPQEIGLHSYVVSLKAGNMEAIGTGGTAQLGDGENGTFTIAETNKSFPDFRGRGVLRNVIGAQSYHLLIESFTELPFHKSGADSPENLFDHPDIDNTVDLGGNNTPGLTNGLHDYNETLGFYTGGDSDLEWQGTKGQRFFGLFEYLGGKNVNSVYVVIYGTDGGDGGASYPWVTTGNRTNYDVSKLAQWQRIVEAANRHGVMVQIVIQESENDTVLSSDEMRIYLRQMAAWLGYNPAIKWNLGEEPNDVSDTQLSNFSLWLDDYLHYQANIAYHTAYNEGVNAYSPAFQNVHLRGTSFQGHFDRAGFYARQIWANTSALGRPPMIVEFDEHSPAIDPPNGNGQFDEMIALWWATVTQGGSGAEYYLGGNQTDWGDQAFDDFTQLDSFWDMVGAWPKFYRDRQIPSHLMVPDVADALLNGTSSGKNNVGVIDFNGGGGKGNTVHFKNGEHYVIYFHTHNEEYTLDLSSHAGKTFNVEWYNPLTDASGVGTVSQVQGGSQVGLGLPFGGNGNKLVAYVSLDGLTPGGGCSGSVDCNNVPFTDDGTGRVIIEAESIQLAGDWTLNAHENGTDNLSGQVGNYITWNVGGSNSIGSIVDDIAINFAVCQDGEYEVAIRMYPDPTQFDGNGSPTDGNDYYFTVDTPNENQFFARHLTTNAVIYPAGSGLTPNPQGDAGVNGYFKGFHNTFGWDSLTQVSEGTGQWEHRPRIQAVAGEVYTLRISGRSYGCSIDRIAIFDVSRYNYGTAIQTTAAETPCSSSNNNPPQVTSIANQTNANGAAINLQVTAIDPNGDTLTYSASGLPTGLSINSTTGLISGTISSGAGTFNPTITVTDNGTPNLQSQISFTWTVTGTGGNNIPVVTDPGDQSDAQGDTVSLQIAASDADGDTLIYSATGLPGGLSINASTGLITGTVTALIGNYIVNIQVADGQGGLGTTNFLWQVTDGTLPPTEGFFAQFSTDCGATWENQSSGFNTETEPATQAATCSVRFRVCTTLEDGTVCCGPETIQDFSVEVQNGSLIVDENTTGNTFDLSQMFTDPLGGSLTVAQLSGPNNGSGSVAGMVFTYAPNTDYDGADVVTFQATDERGGVSAVGTLNITVNDAGGGGGANAVITGYDVSTNPGTIEMCQAATTETIVADQYRIKVQRSSSTIWFSWGNLNFSGCDVQQMSYGPGGGTYGGPGSDIVAQSGDVLIIEATIDNWTTFHQDTVVVP